MKTTTKIAAVAGALALLAGSASAGHMNAGSRGDAFNLHIDFVVDHVFGSTSFVKSLLITVLDPFTGDINPDVSIMTLPEPTVKVFGTNDLRPVLSTELLDVPGGKAVRWTFADDNLFTQGEKLVFGFDAAFHQAQTPDYLIGEDYTFVPTPGAAAAIAGLGVLGASRRRR